MGDAGWARAVKATMSPSPPGDVMLERLVILGAVTLIAFGIVTVFF
jgi:hypothetical protein